jgi:hypothetical protein
MLGRWAASKRRTNRILAWDEGDANVLVQLGGLSLGTHQPTLVRRTLQHCIESKGEAK